MNNTNASTVATPDQDFAIYLLAAKRAAFRGCEPLDSTKVQYLFEATAEEIAAFERDYYAGAQAPVCDVLDALRHLRRAATRTLARPTTTTSTATATPNRSTANEHDSRYNR